MSGAAEALDTADLLDAVRTQLQTLTAVNVLPRIGDRPSAEQRHRCIVVESMRVDAPPSGDRQQVYTIARRQMTIRWWLAARSNSGDTEALDFARDIRAALTGNTTWAHSYKMLYEGQPVAISRDGGYYTGELEVSSGRGLPVG